MIVNKNSNQSQVLKLVCLPMLLIFIFHLRELGNVPFVFVYI